MACSGCGLCRVWSKLVVLYSSMYFEGSLPESVLSPQLCPPSTPWPPALHVGISLLEGDFIIVCSSVFITGNVVGTTLDGREWR